MFGSKLAFKDWSSRALVIALVLTGVVTLAVAFLPSRFNLFKMAFLAWLWFP